jgi:hypothetical protein
MQTLLIITLYCGGGGAAITTETFSNPQACEIAKKISSVFFHFHAKKSSHA